MHRNSDVLKIRVRIHGPVPKDVVATLTIFGEVVGEIAEHGVRELIFTMHDAVPGPRDFLLLLGEKKPGREGKSSGYIQAP